MSTPGGIFGRKSMSRTPGSSIFGGKSAARTPASVFSGSRAARGGDAAANSGSTGVLTMYDTPPQVRHSNARAA